MGPHEIRLRGGWELAEEERPAARVTLPIRLGSRVGGRVRLSRRFSRPFRAAGEPVVLRLFDCPGIEAIRFNGNPVGPFPADATDGEIPLGVLAERNELVIEARPPEGAEDWGAISLIFAGTGPVRTSDPGAGPPAES